MSSKDTSPLKLLIIEDEARIADLLVTTFTRVGYECEVAFDGLLGLAAARRGQADLILLDVMLPGLDGISVCRQIRQTLDTPILMLTAKDQETDKVLGLEIGADDYVTKPFSIAELRARVRSLLRRSKVAQRDSKPSEVLSAGPLRLDRGKRKAWAHESLLELTATEFDLLAHLMASPEQVFSREQLLEKVWGYDHCGYGRTVDSHMNRLRKKVEKDPKHPQFLLTMRGVGYKFQAPE